MIKIRITLESKQDFIRELVIDKNLSLEDLHKYIITELELNEFEMASFYLSDSQLNLGEEISLFDVSDKKDKCRVMSQVTISSVLNSNSSELIYIYDFFHMWRFYVQFIENTDEINKNKLISIGEIPNKAPLIDFEEQNINDKINHDSYFEENFNELNFHE